MRLSEKLSFLRKEHGITQQELAEKLNVSRQAISSWERGTSEPSTENFVRIGKLFGVSVDALLNDDVQIQAESTVLTEVKGQELDKSTVILKGNSHAKFIQLLVVAYFVAVLLLLMAFLYCLERGDSGQEPTAPISIDELEQGKLEEEGAGELYFGDYMK